MLSAAAVPPSTHQVVVLVRVFSGELDAATRLFQFALQTRTGTDSFTSMLHAAVRSTGVVFLMGAVPPRHQQPHGHICESAKLRDTVPSCRVNCPLEKFEIAVSSFSANHGSIQWVVVCS